MGVISISKMKLDNLKFKHVTYYNPSSVPNEKCQKGSDFEVESVTEKTDSSLEAHTIQFDEIYKIQSEEGWMV